MKQEKTTKELKQEVLKALRVGKIKNSTLIDLAGSKRQKYYEAFDFSLLSADEVQEIEDCTIVLSINITKELKILLLKFLQNGFIDPELNKYAKIEMPLFREIDYNKLSKATLHKLKQQKPELPKF